MNSWKYNSVHVCMHNGGLPNQQRLTELTDCFNILSCAPADNIVLFILAVLVPLLAMIVAALTVAVCVMAIKLRRSRSVDKHKESE